MELFHRVPSGGALKQAGCKKKGAEPSKRRPAESGEERAAAIRVLIAEDNMINMKVAIGILKRMGYQQVWIIIILRSVIPHDFEEQQFDMLSLLVSREPPFWDVHTAARTIQRHGRVCELRFLSSAHYSRAGLMAVLLATAFECICSGHTLSSVSVVVCMQMIEVFSMKSTKMLVPALKGCFSSAGDCRDGWAGGLR